MPSRDVQRVLGHLAVLEKAHPGLLLDVLNDVPRLANVIRRFGYELPSVPFLAGRRRPWLHGLLDSTFPPLVADVVIQLIARAVGPCAGWDERSTRDFQVRARATALRAAADAVHHEQRVWCARTRRYRMMVPRDQQWSDVEEWFWRYVRRELRGRHARTCEPQQKEQATDAEQAGEQLRGHQDNNQVTRQLAVERKTGSRGQGSRRRTR
jgi:hypothetical protein